MRYFEGEFEVLSESKGEMRLILFSIVLGEP